MKNLVPPRLDSPLFSPWTDPVSGVTSRLLAPDLAPIQQTFYYINSGFSDDGRHLWFHCAFPPSGAANQGRTLAVADLEGGELRHFPETDFLDGSPMVHGPSGEVYWATGAQIWKRGPRAGGTAKKVGELPRELVKDRRPWRVATHFTLSADGLYLNLDTTLGHETHVGRAPLDGGPVEIWQTLHAGFDHGQFSPVDPDLQLIAQDSYVDLLTGEHHHSDNRMWLIRRGGKARPIYAGGNTGEAVRADSVHHESASRTVADGPRMHGHEWWGADGRRVWFVHYGRGVKNVDIATGAEELVWPLEFASHAHCDRAGGLVVADAQPPARPDYNKVVFLNRATGRQVDIVTHMPMPDPAIRRYHLHPHPRFCLGDSVICYTTMVRGRPDVALVPVSALLAATS